MKEWTAQTDSPKTNSTFETVNGQPQLLSSNKMTHYFKEWITESGIF